MKRIVATAILLFVVSSLFSQRIIYSEPDRNDVRQTNFEIIGKFNNNILIYKTLRDNAVMSVYDADMKQKDRIKLTFLPNRVINADFLAYGDFAYMFYQYQKRNVVYCMAAKFNGEGKLMADPIQLDTTEISFFASNKLYSIINSEDKNFIAVFKINTKNERHHLLTTAVFNKNLELQKKSYIHIAMPEREDYLTEFEIDNSGDLVFARAAEAQSGGNINKLFMVTKPLLSDSISEYELKLTNQYLDDVKIKVDNNNRQYILTSLYTKSRNGNIEGLYSSIWDKASQSVKVTNSIAFDETLRNDAKGDNGIKTAFNDYFLRNVIVRKDGGYLIAAEAFFTTGRGGSFNRNDYLYGSPFFRPSDYYFFSPYSFSYPWSRWGNSMYGSTRYNAQNVAVFSLDNSGKLMWSNIINKIQYDDESDAFIGYQMVNTGDQLHFLFNQQEKRLQLLSDQSVSPTGQLTRNPTLKNLDQGYDFMPRYGKQIGSRQIIIPCMYRNYLCFARLEL